MSNGIYTIISNLFIIIIQSFYLKVFIGNILFYKKYILHFLYKNIIFNIILTITLCLEETNSILNHLIYYLNI